MTDAATLTPQQVSAHVAGASGELGLLKWIETLPARIAVPVLKVAAAHAVMRKSGMAGLPGRGMMQGIPGKGLMQGFGRLGDTVDTTDLNLIPTDLGGTDTSVPAASTVASSTPASSSWLSDIGTVLTNAVQAAGTAYLTVNQVQGANQILQANLQRAQQGLPPLPYTANQLGLTGPTVNLGLSSSTLTPLLLLGGGALVLFAIIGAMKRR